jgi:hypothetical protein
MGIPKPAPKATEPQKIVPLQVMPAPRKWSKTQLKVIDGLARGMLASDAARRAGCSAMYVSQLQRIPEFAVVVSQRKAEYLAELSTAFAMLVPKAIQCLDRIISKGSGTPAIKGALSVLRSAGIIKDKPESAQGQGPIKVRFGMPLEQTLRDVNDSAESDD